MTVEKEKKVVYKNIQATQDEQRFSKHLFSLIQDVIKEDAVADYYKNHQDELLRNFLEDIANAGWIDLSDYE